MPSGLGSTSWPGPGTGLTGKPGQQRRDTAAIRMEITRNISRAATVQMI
jgi:hypothetical protein